MLSPPQHWTKPQRKERSFVHCSIYLIESLHERLDISCRVADLVNDTLLYLRLRKDCLIALGKR